MVRRITLRLLALALGLGVLLAALHLPPVRRLGLGFVLQRIEVASGLEARAERLDYDLPNLHFKLYGLVLGAPGREPLARVDEGSVDLPASSLWGRPSPTAVQATGLRLHLLRDANGSWNLPTTTSAPDGGPPPSVRLRALEVRGAEVVIEDRAGSARVFARGLSLEMRDVGGGSRGTLAASVPVEWSVGDRTGRLAMSPVPIAFDGHDLAVDPLRLQGREGTLELRGRLRDVAGTGTLDLDARAETDLRILHAPGLHRGRLTLSGRVEGTYAAPTAQLSVEGNEVAWGLLEGLALRGRTRLDRQGLSVESVTVQGMGGTLTVDGRLALEEKGKSEVVVGWEGIASEGLRTAGFAGTFAGHGSGAWLGPRPRGLSLTAELRTDPPAVSDPEALPLSGRSELRVHDGSWTLTADHAAGTDLELSGTIRGRFDASDPLASTLAGDLRLETGTSGIPGLGKRITVGRGAVEATLGGTLGAPRAEGSLDAFAVHLPALAKAPADLAARFEADASRVHLSGLEMRTGTTKLVADGGLLFRDRATFGHFMLESPDATALGLNLPAGTDPAGSLHAEGTLAGTLARPELDVRFSGTELRMAGQSFASFSGSARVEGDTVRLDSLEALQEGGRLTLTGEYAPTSLVLRADARGLAVAPVPGALVGRSAPLPFRGVVDLELAASGRPDAPEGKGWITIDRASWEERDLGRLRADLTWHGGRVSADARAEALRVLVAGGMDIAAPHGFELETRLDDALLGPLAERVGLHIEGVTGAVTGRARFRGRLDPGRVDAMEVDGFVVEAGKSRLAVAGALPAGGGEPLRATLDVDLADASPWLPAPASGRLQGSLEVTGAASRPTFEGDLSLEEGTITLPGRRRPARDIAGRARLRDGTLTLERLEGRWSGARLQASGSAPTQFLEPWLPAALRGTLGDAPARAVVQARFEGEARSWLTPLVGDDMFESSGRDASITVNLEADRPRLDAVRGEIRVSGLDPVLSDVALTQEGTARLAVEAGKVHLSDAKWTGPDTEVTVAGALGLPPEGAFLQAPLDVELRGEADLRVLQFAARDVETGGFGGFRLQVGGTLAAPSLQGEIEFTDGLLRYRPARLAVDSLHGTLRFGPDGIVAEKIQGGLNGGSLTLEGELVRKGAHASGELQLRARGAVVEWPPGFHSSLFANLKLAPADEGALLLSGTTVLGSPVYRTTDYFSLQVLGAIQKFSSGPSRPALGNLHLDVQVRSSQEVLIQAVDGRLQVGADLRLGGTASAPVLAGQMTAVPGGNVFMGGRTYELESAVLDFTRGAGLEPWVEVRAQTRVGQYTVLADVTGPATSFRTRLVSDPPLSDRDIVSLLTAGRTLSAAGAGAGRTDALSMLSGTMLGKTGRIFGLDSVRIERTGERGDLDFDPTAVSSQANPTSRLTISQRIRQNLEVTFSQSLTSAGDRTWFVSWKPKAPFELRVAQRDDNSGALEFRHDVAFGAGPDRTSRAASRRRRGRRPEEKVGEVRVRVDEVDAPEKRSGLKLQRGEKFDYEKWLEDRDHLAEAMAGEGYFDARILAQREPPTRERGQPVGLEYEIRRGSRTRLVLEGLTDAGDLRRRIERAWYLSEYGRSIEDEAETLTRAFLFDRGYLQPRVRARTRLSPAAGTKEVTVSVEPGEVSRSHRIVFEGNTCVATERLATLVKGRDKEAWLNREVLRQSVLDLYRGEGRLAAAVEVQRPRSSGVGLELPVVIDEGPEIVLGEVTVAGASGLSSKDVIAASGVESGRPYKPVEIAQARQKVLDAYHRRGWNDASVRIDGELDPETLTVSPAFTVTEGARQVLAEVVIEAPPGLRHRGKESLGLRPGEPVVLDQWAEARKRLYDSGFFKSVDIEPEPIADGDGGPDEEVRAKVTLQPWPALRLRYGLQLVTEGALASEEGRRNFQPGAVAELTRRTLWSLPASVGLSVQARESFQQARAFFTLPRTFGTPLRSSVFLTGTHDTDGVATGPLSQLSQAESRVLELTVEERLRTRGKLEMAGSYNAQWARLDLPPVPPQIGDTRFTLVRLIGTALLDGRNDLIDTTRGYFSSASYEFGDRSLGSDFPIRKLLLQQFVYLPAGRVVFASAARFERAGGEGTAFFPEDRLLAGGANTVRGYVENSLRAAGVNLLGGVTSLLVLNQELRFPIAGPVRGVVFADGAVFEARLEGDRNSESRWSTGLGLRYVTPVGILRLDFGIPLDQGFEPRRGRFYFSLGQVF